MGGFASRSSRERVQSVRTRWTDRSCVPVAHVLSSVRSPRRPFAGALVTRCFSPAHLRALLLVFFRARRPRCTVNRRPADRSVAVEISRHGSRHSAAAAAGHHHQHHSRPERFYQDRYSSVTGTRPSRPPIEPYKNLVEFHASINSGFTLDRAYFS